MDQRRQWIIAQIGSRQHYAVPRGFHSIGQLKRLFTDGWCPRPARPLLLSGNAMMRGFAGRWHAELPPSKVVSWNLRAVRDGIHRARMVHATREQTYREYIRIGREFDASIHRYLSRPGRVDPASDAFFGFNTGCLETIRMLRGRGVPTVLDQIDPARTEEEIVLAEMRKFPGWQEMPGLIPEEYWDRLSAEWASADLVLVNSNWTRTALIQQGVAPEKIIIVPLAYEPAVGPVPMPLRKERPFTVLWLGSVILRKGIQYLMEAARLLLDTDLKFVIAGPIGISKEALNTAPRNMSFIGRVTREQIHDFYQTADIFVLPTLSDGFAITQVEAMNRGLPVIATPNCGEVVEDGKNGLVVPVCDAPALARAIGRLNDDRALLSEMAQNAFIHSTKYLLPNQAKASDAAVAAFVAGRGSKLPKLARVTAVQDGARLHYALPVAFYRSGCLDRMFSEWFLKRRVAYRLFGAFIRRLRRPELRGLVERRCDEIPPWKVCINAPLIVKQRRARARYACGEAYFRWCSRQAGRWIMKSGLADANVLYGFIRNIDPELLRHARAGGALTVADQIIAPAAVERDEFNRQLERWPDWEPHSVHPDFEVLIQFEKETWDALDRIVCASDYVRQGLIAQGIPDSRITLAPYPIDATHFPFIDRRYRNSELTVGFVGAVGLRKGTPYFAQIAKRLRGKNIKFMMVGPVSLNEAAARSTAENVELVGRVNRSRVPEYLERFDVFLFPSTCEGSAGAAMEAMAYGLPIVASPNSGTLVRDGVDGMIRPYDDIDGLCACVEQLAADKSLRLEMGRQARLHAETITIGRYGRELIKVIESDLASR